MNSPVRSRHAQSGVAFYLFVIFALITITAVGGLTTSMLSRQADRSDQTRRTLSQARELVIARLTQPQLQEPGTRLGQITLLPDLPIAAGAGADAAEPAYDGLSETTGCAFRGWASGQNLRFPATSGAAARCFGRLDWRSLGLSVSGVANDDPQGVIPWLILSPNLATGQACLPNLNPLMLAEGYAGYACPTAQPYPWLTVLDERGNVISDRVAFALIAPGPVLPGQVRTATAGPQAWLDTAQVGAACAAPCNPGNYNNADFNHADATPWTLIQADHMSSPPQGPSNYVAPHLFNDTLVFVTADELFAELEKRANRTIQAELNRYQSVQGHLPFAAALSDSLSRCQAGLNFGHVATDGGTCGAGSVATLPAWLLGSGWTNYLLYAVSARCNQSNPACNAPGLVLDARTDINGLLISPGAAIQQNPFATSLGAAQRPITAGAMSANRSDWLDTLENAGGTPDVYVSYAQSAGPRNDRLFPIE